MKFDWSVNLPLILTLLTSAVGFVRMLTRIEESVKNTRSDLDEHTRHEEKQFGSIQEAHRRMHGEIGTLKERQAGLVAQVQNLEKGRR